MSQAAMRYGVCNWILGDAALETTAAFLADAGFDGMELKGNLALYQPGDVVAILGAHGQVLSVTPNEITRWATKILGLYLGQNTMVPSIRIFQEKRLNMKPFFTKVIPLEEGLGAFVWASISRP